MIRQVARLAHHGSDRGVRLALNRLSEQGLVDTVEAPPAVLHTLNRDHIAAPIAVELAGLRAELLQRLRAAASGWQAPAVHASMFGSAARGEGGVHSDIDILVVRSASVDAENATWRAQLDDLVRDVKRWTGNHAGISEISEEDVVRLAAERAPIVHDIERDGVTLAGIDARRLFAANGSR